MVPYELLTCRRNLFPPREAFAFFEANEVRPVNAKVIIWALS
jgi:hypothetical protein